MHERSPAAAVPTACRCLAWILLRVGGARPVRTVRTPLSLPGIQNPALIAAGCGVRATEGPA
eukprot:366268-Chlamydomonas_euryale.AAC.11